MPTVTIEVSEQGETTVAVQGCSGPACKQITAAIEKAIGSTVADQVTPDMHRVTARPQGQSQGAG